MRVPRLYVDMPLAAGSTVSLPADAARHLVTVLRREQGDEVVLFNGSGEDFHGHIARRDKSALLVELQRAQPVASESPLTLHLAQGIAKGERMDWIVQKAVELGVSSITPLFTERTIVRLDGDRLEKRMEHWQGVIHSAAEQSGRSTIPQLRPAQTLSAWLAQQGDTQGVILHPESSVDLVKLPFFASSPVSLLIGPEGGLSPSERAQATQAGFSMARMGPRVLRTETATLVALSLLQSKWGDL